MSKSNVHENEYMLLMFNNVNAAGIGDSTGLRGSAVAGNFYLSLHVGDPGEANSQSTNEVAYTGYARIPVERTAAGFVVNANAVRLAVAKEFPNCPTNTGTTATHIGIGDALTGPGKMRYSGTLAPNINLSEGVTPRIGITADLVTEE